MKWIENRWSSLEYEDRVYYKLNIFGISYHVTAWVNKSLIVHVEQLSDIPEHRHSLPDLFFRFDVKVVLTCGVRSPNVTNELKLNDWVFNILSSKILVRQGFNPLNNKSKKFNQVAYLFSLCLLKHIISLSENLYTEGTWSIYNYFMNSFFKAYFFSWIMFQFFNCFSISMAILLALTVSATGESCQPIRRDCSFYSRCLESAVPCGPTGYAIGFGLPYCSKFEEHYERFSLRGQEWVWTAAYCLQDVLVPVANRQKLMTCEEIHAFAFASHSACYTQPGHSVCDLPFSDWTLLFVMISQELNNPAVWEQMLAVLRTCMSNSSPSGKLLGELFSQ